MSELMSVKCGGQSHFHTNTMLPDIPSPQDAFDINLLDSKALDDPDGLTAALSAIEAVCLRSDSEIAGMVETLNNRSYILEYIISGARQRRPLCVASTDHLTL